MRQIIKHDWSILSGQYLSQLKIVDLRSGFMKVIMYNKLVRDKIPEIIEADNKKCEIEVLSDEKYLEMLDAKLDEELAEYHKDKNLEELADLMEVIYAATRARGYSIEELEAVRVAKESKRGGFYKKILLKEVILSE